MRIYRIESKDDSFGPYNTKTRCRFPVNSKCIAPYFDGILINKCQFVGCLQLDILAGWFIDLLLEYDDKFVVAVYKCEAEYCRISRSMAQVVFYRMYSRKVKEYSCRSLYNRFRKRMMST